MKAYSNLRVKLLIQRKNLYAIPMIQFLLFSIKIKYVENWLKQPFSLPWPWRAMQMNCLYSDAASVAGIVHKLFRARVTSTPTTSLTMQS